MQQLIDQVMGWLRTIETPRESPIRVHLLKRTPNSTSLAGEVQITLTIDFPTYRIQIGIGCSSGEDLIKTDALEHFAASLEKERIPPQLGIYLTHEPLSPQAMILAAGTGVHIVSAINLSLQRFLGAVFDALRPIVYTSFVPDRLFIMSDPEDPTPLPPRLPVYDAEGRYRGTVPHLIWLMWVTGRIPLELGQVVSQIPMPPGWHFGDESEQRNLQRVSFVGTVRGQIFTSLEYLAAISHLSSSQDSLRTLADAWDKGTSCTFGQIEVKSEKELAAQIQDFSDPRLIRRVRLPKLNFNGQDFPMTGYTSAFLTERSTKDGLAFDSVYIDEIERSVTQELWAPLWDDFFPDVALLVAPDFLDVGPFRSFVTSRILQTVMPAEMPSSGTFAGDFIASAMPGARFLISVMDPSVSNADAIFAMGCAQALGKPVLAIGLGGMNTPPVDVSHGLFIDAAIDNYQAIGFALNQVLELTSFAPLASKAALPKARALGGAALPLIEAASKLQGQKDERLAAQLVESALRSGGARVVMEASRTRGMVADLAVWLDELEPWVGNPLPIEVKWNLDDEKAATRALSSMGLYLREAGMRWGLMIHVDGGPPATVQNKFRRSTVLLVSLVSLLDRLQAESFPEILLSLRNRRVHGAGV